MTCSCCLGSSDTHDWDCRYLGRRCRYALAPDYVSIIIVEIDPTLTLLPTSLARDHVEKSVITRVTKPSKSGAVFIAIRNANDLAASVKLYLGPRYVFRDTLCGWPMWWMKDVVLEYCPRPDGAEIIDAMNDADKPIFRYRTHTRLQALQRMKTSALRYMQVGMFLPTDAELAEHGLSTVTAFDWPVPERHLIRSGKHPAVICMPDGSLWVMDTGCGYHLVPEADVMRGKSVVVPNPGARRLHTANGEVRAEECVKFTLQELGLSR